MLLFFSVFQALHSSVPTATGTGQRGFSPAALPGPVFSTAPVPGTYGCTGLETEQACPWHDVGDGWCMAVLGTLPLRPCGQG